MSKGKLNIAMISSMWSEINGTAKAARQLTLALAKLGHDVHIYNPNKPVNWSESLKNQHLFYHEFFSIRPPYEQEFHMAFPVLEILFMGLRKDLLSQHDVVHTQTPEGLAFFGWAAAKSMKIPKVMTAHSPLIFYTEDILGPASSMYINRIFWKYEPLLYNRYDLRSVPTMSKKRFILNQGMKNPILAISNGIEDFYFSKANAKVVRDKFNLKDKKVLLYASRLAPEKNQDIVIKMFKKIHDRVPNSHLVLVGQGPLEPILRNLIEDLNLQNHVTITGFVPNNELLDYYAAADLTTLWSKVEAQGLVLLEAMAQGTPSVGLNAMGIKDVIVDKKTGFLVNNERDYIDRVVEVFTNDHLHQSFRQNCFIEIERHRMENIARTWVKIYELLVDNFPMICAKTPNEQQIRVYQDFVRTNDFVEY